MSPRSEPADGQPDDNDTVDVIVPEYLLAVEQGKKPDREECIKNNPDSATALQSLFADLDTTCIVPRDYETGMVINSRYRFIESSE